MSVKVLYLMSNKIWGQRIIASWYFLVTFEPGHEKMCLMSYANNKGVVQPTHPRRLISAFVVRCLDSIISIAEISRLQIASVAAQTGLCLAWSETPEDTFCCVVADLFSHLSHFTLYFFLFHSTFHILQPFIFSCNHCVRQVASRYVPKC